MSCNDILAQRDEYIQSLNHKWAIGQMSTVGVMFCANMADWQFRNLLEDMGIQVDADWRSYVA